VTGKVTRRGQRSTQPHGIHPTCFGENARARCSHALRRNFTRRASWSFCAKEILICQPFHDEFRTNVTATMPAKAISGRSRAPKGYFRVTYDTLTSPENASVVKSVAAFGVSAFHLGPATRMLADTNCYT